MAKEKTVKDKKEKKEKRSEADGVKKSKKDKKEKKTSEHVTEALIASISEPAAETKLVVAAKADESGDEDAAATGVVRGALVPFAVPLADEKVTKKLFKTVKKGTFLSIQHHISESATDCSSRIQPPRTRRSSAASRKSSRPSASRRRICPRRRP